MKRKHLEELILLISPTTDVHLFPKEDLAGVLKHEILHLKLMAQHGTTIPKPRSFTDEAINIMLADEFFTLPDTDAPRDEYERTWGTPVGQDCIDLCSSLPRWLGERLTFLGNHTSSCPMSYAEAFGDAGTIVWKGDLIRKGAALTRAATLDEYDLELSDSDIEKVKTEAQKALRWAADNLQSLWD